MSKREDHLLVKDILESITRIQEYTGGITYDQLIDDFRSRHNYIPFKEMGGLRNRLVHNYFGVNYDIVWDIIQIDVPTLKEELSSIKFE